MAKPIRLTWQNTVTKEIIEEDCFLLAEGDKLYAGEEEVPGLTELIMNEKDCVIFEDEEGVFGLLVSQVIKIEDREA